MTEPQGEAPRRYRKKPVEVEAIRWDGRPETGRALEAFLGRRVDLREGKTPSPIDIPTLEGVMRADPGDYIIRGVQGEFYPVKPEIFHETYEAVDDDESQPR